MKDLRSLKIWIRLVVGISALLIAAWVGIVWLVVVQQQEMGLKQARDFAASVNQMTIAAMTGMMITGTMDQRAVYLDQIQKTANITALHLVRGEAISKQFGPGNADDHKPDAVEQEVLASGKPYYSVQHTGQGEVLRAGDSDAQFKELSGQGLHELSCLAGECRARRGEHEHFAGQHQPGGARRHLEDNGGRCRLAGAGHRFHLCLCQSFCHTATG